MCIPQAYKNSFYGPSDTLKLKAEKEAAAEAATEPGEEDVDDTADEDDDDKDDEGEIEDDGDEESEEADDALRQRETLEAEADALLAEGETEGDQAAEHDAGTGHGAPSEGVGTGGPNARAPR